MKNRIFWLALSCMMVFALVLIVSGPAAEAAEKKEMIRNVWGKQVEKPRYGGVITLSSNVDYKHTDPWYNWQGTISASPVLEKLGIGDWAIPRDKYDFTSPFVPVDVIKPHLAESYEMPDPLTIIFKIRKGIHWQNKPPMNGRELDAYDIEYSFQRVMGVGEFKEKDKSPYAHMINSAPIESITATDKWTVVVKASKFSFVTLNGIYWASWEGAWISPPEVIKKYGDHRNWRHLVGTGPYMLTDHIAGSSWTYDRNPDYWYKDERFPGMRLPFADKLKVLIIKDRATQLAALRSGKIDVLGSFTYEEAEALKKSNPEIVQNFATGSSVNRESAMQVNKPPFNDLRVRKAMQMAINLKEVAEFYYHGKATSVPFGIGGPTVVQLGYDIPFKDWPEEVKAGYRYDPEKAKKLLAEAGFPKGFKFKYDAFPAADLDLIQLYKAYWKAIGVEAEINVMNDTASAYNKAYKGDFDMTVIGMRGTNYTPLGRVNNHMTGEKSNFSKFSDPEYDRLAQKVYDATSLDEYKAAVKKASVYYASKHITLANSYPDRTSAVQPWIKGGYWGQYATGGGGMLFTIWSRFWVDQKLKK